jgi:type VI protein secretion system component VasK
MFLAAEFGTGQVLWSILWFFLFFLWIWLVITVFVDIMRSDDLSGWAKALWVIAIILLPYLGIFIYLIARGGHMADRHVSDAQAADEAQRAYIRQAAGGSDTADQLASLADMHNNGKLDDNEYAQAKAKVLDQ